MISEMPKAEVSGFVKTLNSMGYMTSSLDLFSQKFVDFCNPGKMVLEIGAAYGVASIEAAKKGCVIIANDLDERHLDILIRRAPEEYQHNIKLYPGRFPDDLSFSENSLDAVLICRVLHFFSGKEIENAIINVVSWLKPDGKLFVVGETPYLKNWKLFIPEYEKRKIRGEQWPGYIAEPAIYEKNRTANLPPSVHWLDEEVLTRTFQKSGLDVEFISTINRTDFPEDLRLDGRESVGIIGVKR